MTALEDITKLNSRQFWLDFAQSKFNISEEAGQANLEAIELKQDLFLEKSDLFKLEGYLQLGQLYEYDFKPLTDLLHSMHQAQLPAVFAFVYDEFWQFQAKFGKLVTQFLGEGAKLMPTVWLWHVDAASEAEILGGKEDKELATRSLYSGFYGPHRDKGSKALFEDGSPKILSFWLPLTEATPLNSCISIVPANRDPTYGTAEDNSWLFKRADIRALPAKPGDVLFWNEAVLHWACRPAPRHGLEPRMSAGFEYVCKDYVANCNPTYDLDYMPSFKERLEIIALQFKLYVTEEGFPASLIEFIKSNDRLLKIGKEEF
ncbi:MAG: phytanoyl-CoA dioxygenase family protein [Candidatus Melainabacteria bacterium]|nr:phytanoyl-CoA dioxygenase family protein [Candidatus Melainabacteria bacterium]